MNGNARADIHIRMNACMKKLMKIECKISDKKSQKANLSNRVDELAEQIIKLKSTHEKIRNDLHWYLSIVETDNMSRMRQE